jgi:hypothetical protein
MQIYGFWSRGPTLSRVRVANRSSGREFEAFLLVQTLPAVTVLINE